MLQCNCPPIPLSPRPPRASWTNFRPAPCWSGRLVGGEKHNYFLHGDFRSAVYTQPPLPCPTASATALLPVITAPLQYSSNTDGSTALFYIFSKGARTHGRSIGLFPTMLPQRWPEFRPAGLKGIPDVPDLQVVNGP